MTVLTRHMWTALMAAVMSVCWTAGATAQELFTLTSTTFQDGQMMPRRVSRADKQNPNCVGENVSPQLSWSGVPAGTKSFAILMDDWEARVGAGVHHWVAYGIPASVTSFAEGEVSKASDKYVGGKSTLGAAHFLGPCPPPGRPHHYIFIIIATDLEPKELPSGLTRAELLAKIFPPAPAMSRSKNATGLVGLFGNSNQPQ